MQKHCSIQFFWIGKLLCVTLNKIPLPMRLLIIMLCISVGCISAANTYAQNTILELNVENQTVESVLNKIEAQTEFMFFYNSKQVDVHRRVSITANKQNVFKILDELFKNTDVAYSVLDKSIILSNKQLLKTENQKKITGKVVDVNGEPIIGATVAVRGATVGTVSDIDGNFVLYVEAGKEVWLDVSYIGYKKQEIKTDGNKPLAITLIENMAMLDEVVVVGYGVQKKVNLTGSVATVSFGKEMNSRPLTNVSSALSGMVPGLNVRQSSGTPGADGASLTLRGASLNGGSPYVLIDGMPGDLNQISPNDIENISVLKDAASAAIYGNKAANGVILITTKSGVSNSGKISFEYNGNVGFSKPTNLFDVISDTPDHMTVINNILKNSGQSARYTTEIEEWREGSKTDPLRYPNTNWWDALIKDNVIQTHQFSARGNNGKISFYTSVNYQDNNGLIPNSSYQSTTFRNNIEYKVNDWLKLGNIMTSMYGKNDPADLGAAFTWFMATTPGMVPQSPDGRYGGAQTVGESGANNLLQIVEWNRGSKEKRRFTTKFFAELTPAKGWKINANYYRDFYSYYESYVVDQQPRWNFQTNTMTFTGVDTSQGYRRQNTEGKADNYNMNVFSSYTKKLKEHEFSLMLGYEQGVDVGKGFSNLRQGLYSPEVPNATASGDLLSGANHNEDAYQSVFSRLNYNLADRYLFELNWRVDGSSRFAEGHRWGHFPSVSLAWRVSEEKFWRSMRKYVENFKLRASYGALGNNNVGLYATKEIYNSANTAFGDKVQAGIVPGGFVNNELTWEKTRVLDIGVDINFLKNFSLSVDFYNKETLNILTSRPISYNDGTSSGPVINGPKVRNRGVEFELNYTGQIAQGLGLQVSLNGALNQNKVTEYQGKDKLIQGGGTPYGYIVEGQPIGKFYIMKVDHIVQSKDEIDAMSADGYRFGLGGIPGPGDFLFSDTYGDKRINENDRVLIGNPQPKFTFGANVGLNYKNIDFNVLFSGVLGWDRYINNQFTSLSAHTVGYLYPKEFLNMYTDEKPSKDYPKVYTNNSKNQVSVGSTWHLHKADYMRIKTIQIGYTLPANISRKIFMDKLRVYANLENFFTITSYPGLDPEIAGDIDYPLLKTASIGINISF